MTITDLDELPSTPEDESRIIQDLQQKADNNLRQGNTYYLISARWFASWKNYTDPELASSERPGPIDNTDLVSSQTNSDDDSDPQLIETLKRRRDFEFLPEEAWAQLHAWYKGGPVIPRKMFIKSEYFNKTFTVDIFPLRLILVDLRDKSRSVIKLSKYASLHELYEEVCKLKELELENVRIHNFKNVQESTILVDSKYQTLAGSKLTMDDQFIGFEVQRDDGSWPSEGEIHEYEGLTGLDNLGNTCFMNSALQCLAHTPPIMDYFLQDYSDEINVENPLGFGGQLALAFGSLLKQLWSSRKASIPPREFKHELGRLAPQFSGNNQHDSQELLAFLLDGLHEDLNRVKQKPNFENKDSGGRPDEEVADEFWTNHKSRNDSVIVDVCQGQYKSTLACPDCRKVSVTFDPFMYLSVPLPSKPTRDITATVYHGDGSGLPTPFRVTVLKKATLKDLSQALAEACGLSTNDEYLLLAEVCRNKIERYFDDSSELLEKIKDGDCIVAYRLPKPKTGTKFTRLEITHRRLQKSFSSYLGGSSGHDQRIPFLTPLVTLLEDPQSNSDIDQAVARVLTPFAQKETSWESPKAEKFHLFLTYNHHGLSVCQPILKNTPLEFKDTVKIVLDWTWREFELYDADVDCLKDIPMVEQNIKEEVLQEEEVSFFSCLDAFLKEEPLGPEDMWYCSDCKAHRQATKKLDLWKLPDVLVFHIKRFSYNGWMKKKLNTMVNFPVHNLDMSNYVSGSQGDGDHTYELCAVSNHHEIYCGGHYTSYCKVIEDDKWYHFDDSNVSQVDEDDIKTSAAYVLFYQRVASKSDGMVVDSSQATNLEQQHM